MSLLGKLHIGTGTDVDTDKVHNILRLVDEAVEDKIASDATSRNALIRLQSALNKSIANKFEQPQSSAQSRSQSVAPSSVPNEEDGSRDVDIADTAEALEDLGLQSTTTTPAASPRKRTSGRTPRRKKASSQTVYEDADEDADGDGDVAMAFPDAATPMASPRKSARSRRTAAAVSREEDPSPEEQENVPPSIEPQRSASPQKKTRGRPKKSTQSQPIDEPPEEEQPSEEPTVEIKVEDDATEVFEEAPMKKAPSRPSRAAAPRKSVRAGRRRATEEEQ